MRINKFYVIGRETPGGAVFLQTYMAGNLPAGHWGDLLYADRFLKVWDAEAALSKVKELETWGEHQPTVWTVEITARKEGCRRKMEETGTQQEVK